MRIICSIAIIGALGGCLESPFTRCADGRLCPADTVCDEVHNGCASAEQIAGCRDVANGGPCSFGGVASGACFDGVCFATGCGNGLVEPGEVCDDGNTADADNCAADCHSDETCGNGVIDSAKGESCDDGNHVDGDGCRSDCRLPLCGDGKVDPEGHEACDAGADNANTANAKCRLNCQPRRCGDGIKDTTDLVETPEDDTEVCDDGNGFAADGCTPDCKSEETCGNGYLDFLKDEECDDGNHLNHDGCAGSCVREQPTWWPRSTTTPTPRSNVGLVYDAARGRAIMFGGESPTGLLNETWEWSGASWINVSPSASPFPRGARGLLAYDAARQNTVLYDGNTWTWDGTAWTQRLTPPPPPREGAVMAYDAGRQRVVLFGGNAGGSNYLDETWEWDGAGWLQRQIPGPSPRARHAMAYDPRRGVIVVFGGQSSDGIDLNFFNDTWEYDGTSWTQKIVASPSARYNASLTWDASRNAVVLIGGIPTTGSADRWEWNGSTWTSVTVSPPLATRAGHAAVFDPRRGRLIVFAGQDNSPSPVLLNDTWECTALSCAPITPATPPPARSNAAFAYDATRGRAILFGGVNSSNPTTLGDTWEWNGSEWRAVVPPTSPTARHSSAFAADSPRGNLLLFGGSSPSMVPLGDTWTWNGTTWALQSPQLPRPTARFWHTMVRDPASGGGTLLFGGYSGQGGWAQDTWTWNGTRWTEIAASPAPQPDARAQHVCTVDERRGAVIVFGGDDSSAERADLWEWDGTEWSDETPPTSPFQRTGAMMVWDPRRGRSLLFGGNSSAGNLADTWEWSKPCEVPPCEPPWSTLFLGASPPPRSAAAMTYAAATGEVVLFGGSSTPSVRNDTWVFRYQAGAIRETCRYGFDTDGDSLIGCADPDCWGQCTPHCPPGVSCDASAPKCGDGVCSQVEDCRLCPGDCMSCPTVCGDYLCAPSEACPGDC